MFRRNRQRLERERARQQARIDQKREAAAANRANNPNARPCPSCGGTDHTRRTSVLCPNFVASRRPTVNTTNAEGEEVTIRLIERLPSRVAYSLAATMPHLHKFCNTLS